MHAFHGTLCVSNGPTFSVLVALIKSNKVHFDGNGHNQAVNAKKRRREKRSKFPIGGPNELPQMVVQMLYDGDID